MATFLDKIRQRAAASIMEYPEAFDYLVSSRKIPQMLVDQYQIGYTTSLSVKPDGSSAFEEIKKESRDFRGFQKRVLFPITNCVGHTMGFSTRRLKDEYDENGKQLPRYRNYVASEAKTAGAFFGIEQALNPMIEKGYVYVTEGAVDCMSLAQVYPNTVSSLTSMLTDAQVWTLSMLVDKVILVFDSDGPGRAGAYKAREKFGDKLIKSLELGYHDANTALTTLGYKDFKKYVENKLKFVNFAVRK
jgi:DNA primase